jgi:endoglycosylceramidase
VIFHGVNMVAKRPPYLPSAVGFGDDDARFLAGNGFTAVRLGVIYNAVEPSAGVYDDVYLDRIAETVSTLGRQGIQSLLDFHQDAYNEAFAGEGFPDWAVPAQYRGPFASSAAQDAALKQTTDLFWTDAPGPGGVGLQERYAAAVAHVAARFATTGSVLGYDLMNEPYTGHRWPQCFHEPVDCSGFDHELGAFQQRVITAIRGSDRNHLVWYEPNVLFNWGLPTLLPRFLDKRVGMSFHDYCAPGPALVCERSAQLRNAEQRATATGNAIMLTEFGGQHPADVTGVTSAADAELMSWMVWAYCGCGDPTGSVPPEAEGLVRDPNQDPAGSNVDQSKLSILARPYPHVIAGTPRQLSFDPNSKDFLFRYTTRRANGVGRFGAGECTEILVPPAQYPTGYSVRATGARVSSASGAGTLTLRATGRSSQITVKIVPNTRGRTASPTLTTGC